MCNRVSLRPPPKQRNAKQLLDVDPQSEKPCEQYNDIHMPDIQDIANFPQQAKRLDRHNCCESSLMGFSAPLPICPYRDGEENPFALRSCAIKSLLVRCTMQP